MARMSLCFRTGTGRFSAVLAVVEVHCGGVLQQAAGTLDKWLVGQWSTCRPGSCLHGVCERLVQQMIGLVLSTYALGLDCETVWH